MNGAWRRTARAAARSIRAHLPVELVYSERHDTRQAAMSREWHIKRMTHEEKLKLIGEAQNE